MTGLTSNPTIFDKAIRDGTAYDADIAARKASGASDEEVFFELALDNLFIKIPGTPAPDVLYVDALAAPFTVDTMPDHTLEAFADHGIVGDLLSADGGDADQVIAAFAQAGIDAAALAGELQRQGAEAFMASWQDLLARIGARHEQLSR